MSFKLPPGVTGTAGFCDGGCHRHYLTRSWRDLFTNTLTSDTALWIGMNPSTAKADEDDPTCQREWTYTRDRLGMGAYLKMNVMNYCSTDPGVLLTVDRDERCTPKNHEMIRAQAAKAGKVIVCYGTLPVPLRVHSEPLVAALLRDGVELWCMGRTKDGSPRHPLYVNQQRALERFGVN